MPTAKHKPNLPVRIAFCLILSVLLIVVLLILYSFTDKVPLLEALPDYPNSVELKFIEPLSFKFHYELLSYNCNQTFIGEKYKAFATKDGQEQILTYYRNAVAKMTSYNFSEILGRSFSEITEPSFNPSIFKGNVICFVDDPHRKQSAAHVIILFDPANSDNFKAIKEVFPSIPSDMRVILLLQGLIIYI